MPDFFSVTLPFSDHSLSLMIRSPTSGVRRAFDGSVAPALCSPQVLGAVLPATRSSIHLIASDAAMRVGEQVLAGVQLEVVRDPQFAPVVVQVHVLATGTNSSSRPW